MQHGRGCSTFVNEIRSSIVRSNWCEVKISLNRDCSQSFDDVVSSVPQDRQWYVPSWSSRLHCSVPCLCNRSLIVLWTPLFRHSSSSSISSSTVASEVHLSSLSTMANSIVSLPLSLSPSSSLPPSHPIPRVSLLLKKKSWIDSKWVREELVLWSGRGRPSPRYFIRLGREMKGMKQLRRQSLERTAREERSALDWKQPFPSPPPLPSLPVLTPSTPRDNDQLCKGVNSFWKRGGNCQLRDRVRQGVYDPVT